MEKVDAKININEVIVRTILICLKLLNFPPNFVDFNMELISNFTGFELTFFQGSVFRSQHQGTTSKLHHWKALIFRFTVSPSSKLMRAKESYYVEVPEVSLICSSSHSRSPLKILCRYNHKYCWIIQCKSHLWQLPVIA